MIESAENSLTIRRMFDAPRERVFRAFFDLDDLEAWHSIGDLSIVAHTIDTESGDSLPVSQFIGGDRVHFEGELLEVVGNVRLASIVRGVDGRECVEYQISTEFRDVDEGTEVVVSHQRLDPEIGSRPKGSDTDRTRT